MRQLVERDLIAAYRLFVPTAVEIINSGKEAYPQLFFVQMHKQQPGTVAKVRVFDPTAVKELHASPESKRLLLQMVKAVLGTPGAWPSVDLPGLLAKDEGFAAHIGVHLSEAWMVKSSTPTVDVAPSEHPDRFEVLNIHVFVRDYTYWQFLPIETRDDKRHCEMLPWSPHDPRGKMYSGNLSIQKEPLP